MAKNKHKLIVVTDATFADVSAAIDPKYLIAKSAGRFKFWFESLAELKKCQAAAEKELGATCDVFEAAEPEPEPKPNRKARKKKPVETADVKETETKPDE